MSRRRLFVLGQALDVEPLLPEGVPLEDALFEAARVVSEAITARARERERVAHGLTVSCKEGCAACCQHLVPISPIEAARIARRATPKVKKRFAEAVARLERAGLLDAGAPRGRAAMTIEASEGESLWDALSRRYRELGIPCPFLENRRCSIYADRPLVCREYAVTSPAENCGRAPAEVDAVPRPVRMSEALADMTGADSIPLVLSLEWSEHHRPELPPDPARALVDAIVVED